MASERTVILSERKEKKREAIMASPTIRALFDSARGEGSAKMREEMFITNLALIFNEAKHFHFEDTESAQPSKMDLNDILTSDIVAKKYFAKILNAAKDGDEILFIESLRVFLLRYAIPKTSSIVTALRGHSDQTFISNASGSSN